MRPVLFAAFLAAASAQSGILPTIVDKTPASSTDPSGMVWIPEYYAQLARARGVGCVKSESR